MIQFYKGFLVGRRRIAIEEMNIIAFNEHRVGELAAIVGKKNRKNSGEGILESQAKGIKTGNHRGRSVSVPKKSKHEITGSKMQSQKDLSTDTSNNTVHLNNAGVRVFFKEGMKIGKRTSDSASLVNLHGSW